MDDVDDAVELETVEDGEMLVTEELLIEMLLDFDDVLSTLDVIDVADVTVVDGMPTITEEGYTKKLIGPGFGKSAGHSSLPLLTSTEDSFLDLSSWLRDGLVSAQVQFTSLSDRQWVWPLLKDLISSSICTERKRNKEGCRKELFDEGKSWLNLIGPYGSQAQLQRLSIFGCVLLGRWRCRLP